MSHSARRGARPPMLILTALLAAGACSHAKPELAAAPPPAPAPPTRLHSIAWEDSVILAKMTRDHQRVADSTGAAQLASLHRMIFFGFDEALLSDSDQRVLQEKLARLEQDPALRLQIAGNCDDRGSDEYNLALGERRAAAAKRWLVEHGIAASRIEIISYGRERPVATGDDEGAWAMNRNDQFKRLPAPASGS
jgi:peptidoglycan-associated lipoprotein